MTNTMKMNHFGKDEKDLAVACAEYLTNSTGDEHVVYYVRSALNPWKVGRLPQIGDEVSKSFNGDTYPEGKIVKMWKDRKAVFTDTGVRFSRVGDMCWKEGGKDGAFSMIQGHKYEQNPHF